MNCSPIPSRLGALFVVLMALECLGQMPHGESCGDRLKQHAEHPVVPQNFIKSFAGNTGATSQLYFSPDSEWIITPALQDGILVYKTSASEEENWPSSYDSSNEISLSRKGDRWEMKFRVVDLNFRQPEGEASRLFITTPVGIEVWDFDQILEIEGEFPYRRVFRTRWRNGGLIPDENIQVSQDGTTVLRPEYVVGDGAVKNRIRVWNARTRTTERLIGTSGSTATLSPSGDKFATAGYGRSVRIWTVTGIREREMGEETDTHHITYSPDGNVLAIANPERVRLYLARASTALPVEIAADSLRSITISPESSFLAMQSWSGNLEIFNAKGERAFVFEHDDHVKKPVFSPDESMVATYSCRKFSPVFIWSLESGQLLAKLPDIPNTRAVAFSPDGRFVAYASAEDGRIQLVNIQDYLKSLSSVP